MGKVAPEYRGRPWIKPKVSSLIIGRDTFSGSVNGVEIAGKSGLPAKR